MLIVFLLIQKRSAFARREVNSAAAIPSRFLVVRRLLLTRIRVVLDLDDRSLRIVTGSVSIARNLALNLERPRRSDDRDAGSSRLPERMEVFRGTRNSGIDRDRRRRRDARGFGETADGSILAVDREAPLAFVDRPDSHTRAAFCFSLA